MSESKNQRTIIRLVDDFFEKFFQKLLVPKPRTGHRNAKPFHSPLIAVVNEGKRSKRGHYNAKRAGLAKGFPDMQLLVARNGYNGLLIENKYDQNTRTTEQIIWADWLNANGYLCVECRSVDAAFDTVVHYMMER